MTVLYVLLAVLMFGVMITVHEAGHFFASRAVGIPVKEFAIGFGPKLISWNSKKHETVFFLRAIPVGGYCMFYGEDDVSGKESDDPRRFGNYAVWKRMISVLMGPVMNFVLAFVVAVAFYAFAGVPKVTGPYETAVQQVTEGSPADTAGLKAGDRFLTVNGETVRDNLNLLIDKAGESKQPAEIAVRRAGDGGEKVVTLTASPLYSEPAGRYLLGITVNIYAPSETVPGSAGEVILTSWRMCVQAGSAILKSLEGLFSRGEGFGEMSGFVGVTKVIVEETRRSQLTGYLSLMIFISINLGLVNLLPFPGLDGSRFVFLVVEGLRGRPAKREAYVHAAGMVVLFGFIIFITLRDILRLF